MPDDTFTEYSIRAEARAASDSVEFILTAKTGWTQRRLIVDSSEAQRLMNELDVALQQIGAYEPTMAQRLMERIAR